MLQNKGNQRFQLYQSKIVIFCVRVLRCNGKGNNFVTGLFIWYDHICFESQSLCLGQNASQVAHSYPCQLKPISLCSFVFRALSVACEVLDILIFKTDEPENSNRLRSGLLEYHTSLLVNERVLYLLKCNVVLVWSYERVPSPIGGSKVNLENVHSPI